jgi:putative peptidoglycan lipid II flippase
MKLAIQLSVLSAANIGIAFLFQLVVLTQLGPGVETDALFAGMTMPQLVLTVISGSLMHVLVPIFSGANPAQLRHDAWALMTLVAALFGMLALILFVAAPLWVPLTVPGFDLAAQQLTIQLSQIQLVGMVFTAVNGVQWAAYHARHQFIWAEFSPLAIGIVALAALYWALPRYGIVAAAWISTARMMLQTLVLAPGMGRPVWPELRSAAIRQAWGRIKPLLLGTAYYKTDPLIDRFLLSTANSGSLSLYYLAQQIYTAATQVINKAITSPLVPVLSKLHKAGDTLAFARASRRKLLVVGMLCATGLLVLGVAGQEILRVLIGHRNVSDDNVLVLWWIMIWLCGMFLGSAMGQITSSTFYARGDTVTPVRLSAVTYTIYIPSKIAVYFYWGVPGLAVATSVYQMTNLALQMWYLKKQLFNLTVNADLAAFLHMPESGGKK